MLRFDNSNKLFYFSNKGNFQTEVSRTPLLLWCEESRSTLSLRKEKYTEFEAKLLTTCLIQDLQLFRDELFKDCLVIGKFSFVRHDEIKLWGAELCSKSIPIVDITYNNGEIQVIKSYISPEEYRDKICFKYMF